MAGEEAPTEAVDVKAADMLTESGVAACVEGEVRRNEAAWKFYERIGSPKYVVAPMVDQSELPYRLLCRRHGADLAYTPMFHSRLFAEDPKYRRDFTTCTEDRPLFVQFCGNDPATLLRAAKLVEKDCDAVDLNLGCPQGIARKGRYGSFLLTETDLLYDIVKTLHDNLSIPVTCKIRKLPTLPQTIHLARTLESAGCSLLTIHGRTKEQNKDRVGSCDWDTIRAVRQAVGIPVVANGGIADLSDVKRCMEHTGVVGVMTSEAILENPYLFSGVNVNDESQEALTLEYLAICEEMPECMPNSLKCIRAHCFHFLHTALQLEEFKDLRDQLASSRSFEEIRLVAEAVVARRRALRSSGFVPDTKVVSWYSRHQTYKANCPRKVDQHGESHEDTDDVLDLSIFD